MVRNAIENIIIVYWRALALIVSIIETSAWLIGRKASTIQTMPTWQLRLKAFERRLTGWRHSFHIQLVKLSMSGFSLRRPNCF